MQILYDATPVTTLLLPEQPRGRIPRTVVSANQPSPVGNKRQHHPHGLAECAGEMSNHRIDRDDQIEAHDGSGGLGKIAQKAREVGYEVRGNAREVGLAIAHLKRKPTSIMNTEQ